MEQATLSMAEDDTSSMVEAGILWEERAGTPSVVEVAEADTLSVVGASMPSMAEAGTSSIIKGDNSSLAGARIIAY